MSKAKGKAVAPQVTGKTAATVSVPKDLGALISKALTGANTLEKGRDSIAGWVITSVTGGMEFKTATSVLFAGFDRLKPEQVILLGYKTSRSAQNSILNRCGRVAAEMGTETASAFDQAGYATCSQSPAKRAENKDRLQKAADAAREEKAKKAAGESIPTDFVGLITFAQRFLVEAAKQNVPDDIDADAVSRLLKAIGTSNAALSGKVRTATAKAS